MHQYYSCAVIFSLLLIYGIFLVTLIIKRKQTSSTSTFHINERDRSVMNNLILVLILISIISHSDFHSSLLDFVALRFCWHLLHIREANFANCHFGSLLHVWLHPLPRFVNAQHKLCITPFFLINLQAVRLSFICF